MWHDESAATSASSGSTAVGSDIGTRTDAGALDAFTTAPPSKRHSCAREYLLSLNGASGARVQTTVAMWLLMIQVFQDAMDFSGGLAGAGGLPVRRSQMRSKC